MTSGNEPASSSHLAEEGKEEWTLVTQKGRDRGKRHAQPDQTKHGTNWGTLGGGRAIVFQEHVP